METQNERNAKIIPDKVIRMELISFFNHYPATIGSSEEVALRLGRDREQVERQMDNLVRLHILENLGRDGAQLYRYVPALSIALVGKKTWEHDRNNMTMPHGNGGRDACGFDSGEKGHGILEYRGTSVRLQLMIVALKKDGWKECLELLLDIIHHAEDVPCAAYWLGDGCSELLWDCQRGSRDTKIGMSRVDGVQNMVIEGELISNKGILDNGREIKFLYPLDDGEDILICVDRNGHYRVDADFLGSLLIDVMPVIAGKRRMDIAAERAAEKALQDDIHWNIMHNPDVETGLVGALASLAKSVGAERTSLMLRDDNGCLRTIAIYGERRDKDVQARTFPVGKGLAGWCVEMGHSAIIANARLDPRFVASRYDDIDAMLCCPLMSQQGEAVGAICAVNKISARDEAAASFDERDIHLVEGAAKTVLRVVRARESKTRRLPRGSIDAAVAAKTA